MFDFNKELEAQALKFKTELGYRSELMRFLINMFKYEGLPNTLESRFLELYLHTFGSVVVGTINDELYCVPPNLQGEIDAYNLGSNAFGVCPVGEIRGKRGVDVVWGLNNKMAFPDLDVVTTSQKLTEIDTSILNNIRFSRMHPIPVARDLKSKIAIDDVLRDLDSGETKTILSDNVLNELDSGIATIDLINLTDVAQSDKLQYLFHSKDDVYRQFYTKFGQAVQGTGKMAQQTEREIDGSTSMSFVHPIDMLECRLNMCDEINRIFGTNISVDFSDCWKKEYEKYFKEEEIIEEVDQEGEVEDVDKED